MANRQRKLVSYRQFRPQSRQPEGLPPVARDNGDAERRVAGKWGALSNQLNRIADRQAAIEGERAGKIAAAAGAPEASVSAPGPRPAAPQEIEQMIRRVAGEEGADAEALLKFAHIESTYNPNAFNKDSKAAGLFQFIPSTARQYGLTDPYDPEANTRAAIRLMRDNAGHLRKSLGRDPTVGELYLAHQQGAGGASKLLKNPNARAADIVGSRAVSLNGGSADMTAQSFANLWISKASAPGTVLSGRPATFRPTNSSTIRGRAYDVAGNRAYLQQLDVVMQKEIAGVYEAYNEDPVMLERALGTLRQQHLDKDVYPEIASDYTVAFDAKANRAMERSREAFKIRQEKAERTEFLGRIDELEEEKARFLAGQNAGAERDAEDLWDIQTSIDDHYDNAVERGLMSADDAERLKKTSLRSTAVSFYLSQASGKTAEEIEAMRLDMAEDYAAGELETVDRDSYSQIDAGLKKLAKDRETAEVEALQDVRRFGDDLAERVLAGETVPPHEIANFSRLAGLTQDGKAIASSALRRIRVAHALKTNPLPNVLQNLEDLVKNDKGEIDADDLAFARKLVEKHQKALDADPLAVAERHGTLPVIDGLLEDMQAAGAIPAVEERIDAANAAASHFGVTPKYFTGNEPARIAELIRENPDQGLALVAGIVEAGGDVAGDMLRELRETSPEAEWAGTIFALGGSARAAQDVLLGNHPGPDGKALPNVKKSRLTKINGDVMGDALSQLHPDDQARVQAGAMSIARRRLSLAGVDPDSDEAEAIYQTALNDAAGAVAGIDDQLGGFGEVNDQQILLPPGMSAEGVQELLDDMSDADLEKLGKPLSPLAGLGVMVDAYDVADGLLFAVAPGIYRVAYRRDGALEFIADPAGGPWELDIARLAQIQNQRLLGGERQ